MNTSPLTERQKINKPECGTPQHNAVRAYTNPNPDPYREPQEQEAEDVISCLLTEDLPLV